MDDGPVLSDVGARKDSIVNNAPAVFIVEGNPAADGSEPFYELEVVSQVAEWCGIIHFVAAKHGVEPNLAKAIMFMETTHGWYDKFYPFRKTILPMNIHYKYWRKLGVTKELLGCPYYNIAFGVILLSRIAARVKDPTPRKIATLYNFIGANKVNNYGARVAKIMKKKPWVKRGC